MGRFAPPGYPKMMSTPSRWRASRTISAPVIVAPTTRRSKRKPPPLAGALPAASCCSSGRANPRLSEARKEEVEDYERSCHQRVAQSTEHRRKVVVNEPQRPSRFLWNHPPPGPGGTEVSWDLPCRQ